MSETGKSPLDAVARPGRFGALGPGGPGVHLSLRHPASIITIIARKGKAKALSAAMQKHYGAPFPAPGRWVSGTGINLHWAGADQWLAVAAGRQEGALFDALSAQLAGLASLSDQSHGRVIVSVSGHRARAVLAKGTAQDLHPHAFGVGACAVTQMDHIGVHISQTGPDDFEISLFRGFAQSFWEWLTLMSLEFGYQVE